MSFSNLPAGLIFYIDYQYFTNPPDIDKEYHRLLTKLTKCLAEGWTLPMYPLESYLIDLEEFVKKNK